MQKIIYTIIFLMFFCNTCYASEVAAGQLDSLNFKGIQKEIDNANVKVDFKDEVKKIITGETKFSFQDIVKFCVDLFVKEFRENFGLVGQIILLTILSAVLKNITASFQNKEVGEIGFYVCYIMIIILMLKSYKITLDIAYNTINTIMSLMKFAIPLFISTLISSGHITTATMTDSVVFASINYAAILIKNIILPLTGYLCVMQIINFLSNKEVLNEFNDLLKKIITFSLKGMLSLFFGLSVIQRFTAPVLDGIAKKGVETTAKTFVPIVGDAMNSAVDTFLSCMGLLKNSVGIVAVMVIIFVSIIPLIKLLALFATYKITAAIMQPIAEAKIVKSFSKFSENCTLIFMCLLSIVLIFITSIALIISI